MRVVYVTVQVRTWLRKAGGVNCNQSKPLALLNPESWILYQRGYFHFVASQPACSCFYRDNRGFGYSGRTRPAFAFFYSCEAVSRLHYYLSEPFCHAGTWDGFSSVCPCV